MFEADGTWTPTALTTDLNAATDTINIVSTSYYYAEDNTTDFTGSFSGGGTITMPRNVYPSTETDWRYSITNQDWGIEKSIMGGTYTGPTSDTWNFVALADCTQGWGCGGSTIDRIIGTQTEGTKWSADVNGNNVLAGQTYGYGADITNTPMTWIGVGETIGTFDPALFTWQAVQTGAWLETAKFLGLATAANAGDLAAQATLNNVNIPFAEVGKADLAGNDGNLYVNMNNVTFFAYQAGFAPKIWATDSVSGSYTADPTIGTIVTLNGSNGLIGTADFTVQQWAGGNWISTVAGSGTLNRTDVGGTVDVNLQGAAAGTYGSGSITSGTGAGTAQ